MHKSFWIFLLFIFAGGAIFTANYIRQKNNDTPPTAENSQPVDVVKAFYAESLKNNIKAAMDLTTNDRLPNEDAAMRMAPKAPSVKSLLQQWAESINENRIKIDSIKDSCIKGKESFVILETENKDSKKEKIAYKLGKVGNEWKIYTFASYALVEDDLKCKKDEVKTEDF